MKILHAVTKFPPAIGGHEKLVKDIAESQAERGHAVHVATSNLKRHFKPVERLTEPVNDSEKFRVTRLKGCGTRGISFPFIPGMYTHVFNENFDIAHVHCLWQHPAYSAAKAVLRKKKKFVLSPVFHNRTEFPRTGLLWKTYLKKIWPVFKRAKRLLLHTTDEYYEFRKAGLVPENWEILSPPVDENEFSQDGLDDFFNGRFDLPENAKKILLVGRLGINKGVDLLIKAAPLIKKQVPEAYFFAIGPRDEGGVDFSKMIRDEGVSDFFHLLDSVSREELVAAFRQADLFTLPSRYETFGIVLAEAMMARTPVVAMRKAAIPYVVEDGETGLLFEPENHAELAELACKVLKDNRLSETLAENGRNTAIRKYSRKNYIRRLEEIYTEVLAE